MHAYDLSPLFRSTVGFDHISQLLDTAFKADERNLSYPPYNIIKVSDDEYRVVMAVAGFGMDDLNIVVKENALSISGAMAEKEEEQGLAYLHKGIAARSFERTFSLADHVKVTGAELEDGLLTLHLKREVPEESKPRVIPIATTGKVSKASGKKAIENK